MQLRGISRILNTWEDYVYALGIDPQDTTLIKIDSAIDADESLKLPTGSALNEGIANLYINFLKEKSTFFRWADANIK